MIKATFVGLIGIGLVAGTSILGSVMPAAAALPALTVVSVQVSGDQAAVAYKVNRKTTRPKTRVCSLNGDQIRCGKLTASTSRALTYTAKWSGLEDGAHRFFVSIKRTAAAGGGWVSRGVRFVVGVGDGACNVNLNGKLYSGGGRVLQDAINAAGNGGVLNVAGTCVGNFRIPVSVTLAGPPTGTATLDGNQAGRVLTVIAAGSVALDNLTITAGEGGIENYSTLTITDSTITGNITERFDQGGGIQNFGALTVSGSTISDNVADTGGGIYSDLDATLTVTDSVISGNSADSGGGGGIANNSDASSVIVTDTTITGNTATNGGGIFNGGSVVVQGAGTVSSNTADAGGGIYNSGTLTLQGSSSVTSNVAEATFAIGGGVFNAGTVTLRGLSSVTGNSAVGTQAYGGGIYEGGVTCSDGWAGAVSPNTPDDPPTVSLCG